MRLIAPADYRPMPWKNGGGTTFEVAMHPPGADWGSFAWRVSIAEVASSGPFSSLPGIDRALVVVGGQGMVLTGIREDAIDVRPYDCVAFAGEARVASVLVDGPTRDFNVMTRRGCARADVRVVRDRSPAVDGAGTLVCHAASKSCACTIDGTVVEVPEGHTLVAEVERYGVDVPRTAVAIVAMVTP